MQSRGADPGKVIDRLSQQIGVLSKELAIAIETANDAQGENEALRQKLEESREPRD
jgi:regulator of replication initiation timing